MVLETEFYKTYKNEIERGLTEVLIAHKSNYKDKKLGDEYGEFKDKEQLGSIPNLYLMVEVAIYRRLIDKIGIDPRDKLNFLYCNPNGLDADNKEKLDDLIILKKLLNFYLYDNMRDLQWNLYHIKSIDEIINFIRKGLKENKVCLI